MAQKFGGKYSPEGAPDTTGSRNKFRGRSVHNSNIRVKLLYLAPLPLFLAAIGEMMSGNAGGMIAELAALCLLLASPWLLSQGLEAETAYNARKVARPPAIPRKLFAAILSGAGVGIASFFGWNVGLIPAVVFGAVASLAHVISFGLDPMSKKGMEGVNEFEAQRVAKAVDKAEGILTEMLTAAKRFGDRRLEGRVESLAAAARDMFRAVEEDPRDLTGAKKFMGVYLKGARDATIKFADLYAKNKDQKAREDYETLLTDLETSFDARHKTMLLEDRSDLDVEIEVLRDRLKQEGLRAQL